MALCTSRLVLLQRTSSGCMLFALYLLPFPKTEGQFTRMAQERYSALTHHAHSPFQGLDVVTVQRLFLILLPVQLF